MYRDEVVDGLHRDAARMADALAEGVRARRAAEARAAELALELAVWKARCEEAEARERLAWLRRVA